MINEGETKSWLRFKTFGQHSPLLERPHDLSVEVMSGMSSSQDKQAKTQHSPRDDPKTVDFRNKDSETTISVLYSNAKVIKRVIWMKGWQPKTIYEMGRKPILRTNTTPNTSIHLPPCLTPKGFCYTAL